MADQVQVNYEEMETISRMFDENLQRVQDLNNQVRASMSQLEGGGWIGLGADKFFAEMNDLLLPAVQRLMQSLEESNNVARQITDALAEAEETAGQLFRGRA